VVPDVDEPSLFESSVVAVVEAAVDETVPAELAGSVEDVGSVAGVVESAFGMPASDGDLSPLSLAVPVVADAELVLAGSGIGVVVSPDTLTPEGGVAVAELDMPDVPVDIPEVLVEPPVTPVVAEPPAVVSLAAPKLPVCIVPLVLSFGSKVNHHLSEP